MFQKLFWSFSDWINCSINLKTFAWPSALNFSKFFPINWTIFFSQQIRIFSQILINITSVNNGHKFKNIDTFWPFFWPFFGPFFGPFCSKLSTFSFFFSNFRHRQRQQWSQIRSYRRNQEEIKAERRFHLHQELKSTVRQRRERALQDFIRVNLRWVKNGHF